MLGVEATGDTVVAGVRRCGAQHPAGCHAPRGAGGTSPNQLPLQLQLRARRARSAAAASPSASSSHAAPAGAPSPSTSMNDTSPGICRHEAAAAATSNARGGSGAMPAGDAGGVRAGVDAVEDPAEDVPARGAKNAEGIVPRGVLALAGAVLAALALARTRRSSATETVCAFVLRAVMVVVRVRVRDGEGAKTARPR
jgi:hypothetical protein